MAAQRGGFEYSVGCAGVAGRGNSLHVRGELSCTPRDLTDEARTDTIINLGSTLKDEGSDDGGGGRAASRGPGKGMGKWQAAQRAGHATGPEF